MEYTIKNFPNSWDEVPLKYGRKLFQINSSGMTDHQYLEEVIKCFDIDINNYKIEDINNLKYKVLNLISSKPNETMETEFIINGIRYHLVKDLKQLTFGEFLDLELLLSQSETSNIFENLHNVLGVMLREQTKVGSRYFGKVKFEPKPYDSEKVLENAKLFDKVLSVNDVYGFSTFFLLQGIVYSHNLVSSLGKELKNPQN